MNELDRFFLQSNTRLVLARWLYLLIGIMTIVFLVYGRNNNLSSDIILPEGQLMIIFFLTALVNFFWLFISQFLEAREYIKLGKIFGLFQIIFDLLIVFLVVSLIHDQVLIAPIIFIWPIAEAVILFNVLGPVITAFGSSLLLAYLKGDQPGEVLLFGGSFLFTSLIFSYYYQQIKPFNIFLKQKEKVEDRSNQNEQIKLVRQFGHKVEDVNRKLYAKDLELKLMRQELETLEEAKSKFISVTAHQMRTPLSAIKWTFNMLIDGQLGEINEEQKKFIQQGSESADRMIGIVNSLLQVDNIDAKWHENDKLETVDLVTLIAGVINEFSNQIRSKEIDFVFKEPASNLPTIEADPSKVKMVIENLLDNAIKYTPEKGRVSIEIRDDKVNSAQNSIEVIIRDSGIGIPSNEQNNLFTKFFRASNAVSVEPNGSGVGLYIAKDIIERHNGALWFESKASQGTSFHFTIPISQPKTDKV